MTNRYKGSFHEGVTSLSSTMLPGRLTSSMTEENQP